MSRYPSSDSDHARRLSAANGFATGLLIVAPFWVSVAWLFWGHC